MNVIKKTYLFPQFYIHKQAFCDDCDNVILEHTGNIVTQEAGEQLEYRCPKCNKIYLFSENDLKGEWKWRTI